MKKDLQKYTENLPAPAEKEREAAEPLPDDLLASLSVQEIEYATQIVLFPSKDPSEIAHGLYIKPAKHKKIRENPNVQRYINYLKRTVHKMDLSIIRSRHGQLLDKMYLEMASRFQDVDIDRMNELNLESTSERALYLKRYAEFASFKDMGEMYFKFMNMFGIQEDSIEKEDEDEFLLSIRSKFHVREMKRKGMIQAMQQRGVDISNMFDIIEVDDNGMMSGFVTEAPQTGTVIEQEISIFARSNRNGKKEEE